MTNRTVFVDLGDTHGPLNGSDVLTDNNNVPFVLRGSPAGILAAYATLAAAIADTANLYNGQFVMINGGDNASTGFPNADKGVWKVNTNQGASASDYSKVLDGTDKASEVNILDTNGFYAGSTVETALDEIGTKQVFYKRGDTSLRGVTASGTSSNAWDSAIAALVLDNGSFTDATGAGTSTVNGVILTTEFGYQIPVRKAASRDIVTDGSNNEVYARLTYTTEYVISFYSYISGVETAFNMPSQSLDLGFVLASMDFMKLPAFAGVTDSEFFGDEAGAVGTISDEQVVTNVPSFTGMLTGMATQEAVNLRVDSLGLTTTGNGASRIKIEDAAGNFTATDVEAALAELWTKAQNRVRNFDTIALAITQAGITAFSAGEYVIIKGTTGNEAERGIYILTGNGTSSGHYSKVLDISHTAAEVLIADAGNYYTGTQVEAALTELAAAIGGTNSTTRDYSSNTYVADNDSLVVAIGKLDAAVSNFVTNRLLDKTLVAEGAIDATSDGPRLVGYGASSNHVSLLDASQSTLAEPIGFATGDDYVDEDTIDQGDGVVFSGLLPGFTGLTPGAAYYADPANPGDITSTVPTTLGYWIIPVGVAITATQLLVRIGEPNQIVPAEKTQQVGIHFKSTDATSSGLGENGYVVTKGDIWIDNDDTVQNPTKSGTDRHTAYIALSTWTGTGASLTPTDINTNFVAIGTQG
jgi:hypothetical protein